MPHLGITPSGELYEIDNVSHESHGIGRLPQNVDASSTLLDSAETILALAQKETSRQATEDRKRELAEAQARGQAQARRSFGEAMYRETMARQHVPFGGKEKMIADGVMEMERRRIVDFDRNAVIDVTSDFGREDAARQEMGVSRADYNWHRPDQIYDLSSPLRPEGTVGPITDYERFVNEAAEPGFVGADPGGMNVDPNQAEFPGQSSLSQDAKPAAEASFAGRYSRAKPGQSGAMGGIPMLSHPMGDFWDDVSASITEATPDLLQQAEAGLLQTLQPRPAAAPAPIYMLPPKPATALPVPAGHVHIPLLGNVSKTSLYIGLAAIAGGVLFMSMRRRRTAHS